MHFLEGFGIGLGMIIFIGPVFFLLLNSSLQHGAKAGVAVALGIIFSDIVCVLLCYYGFSSFVSATENQYWIGSMGSVIIFGLGLYYLFKKVEVVHTIPMNSKKIKGFFIKGFSVNFFNPFVFVVWISVYNYGESKFDTEASFFWFLVAVLVGILTTDLLKVFLSEKVKKLLSLNILGWLFRVTGIILLFFSIRMLWLIN